MIPGKPFTYDVMFLTGRQLKQVLNRCLDRNPRSTKLAAGETADDIAIESLIRLVLRFSRMSRIFCLSLEWSCQQFNQVDDAISFDDRYVQSLNDQQEVSRLNCQRVTVCCDEDVSLIPVVQHDDWSSW